MEEVIACENGCGTTYKVKWEKIAFRDKDTYECDVCNGTAFRWNGSRLPSVQEVIKPT